MRDEALSERNQVGFVEDGEQSALDGAQVVRRRKGFGLDHKTSETTEVALGRRRRHVGRRQDANPASLDTDAILGEQLQGLWIQGMLDV